MYAGSFIADAVSSFVSELVDNVDIENLMTSAEYKIVRYSILSAKRSQNSRIPKLISKTSKRYKARTRRKLVVYAPSWEHDGERQFPEGHLKTRH